MPSSKKTHGVGDGSETPLATPSFEDLLEQQKRIWIQEQEIVASMVQVHSDPTTFTDTYNMNSSATIVVEDTQWCRVLRFSDSKNGGVGEENEKEGANTGSPKEHDSINRHYYFGGVDVGFPNPPPSSNRSDENENPMAVATYVIIDVRTMKVVYRDHEWIPMSELPPYISTFLAFREIQFLERLVRKQMSSRTELTPFAILVDGNGIFHPRRAGIACFLGVRTGIPTIGIGKTLLYIENNEKGDDDENNDDAYRWTRSKLDNHIDVVLADVLRNILHADDEIYSANQYPPRISFRNRLEIHKGLILPTMGSSSGCDIEENEFTSSKHMREQLLEGLAPFCSGIAIPLEAPLNHNNNREGNVGDGDRFWFLGAALVGHGGRRVSMGKTWIKRPIIVSVGHKISLAEAVSITATLSLFRIPEPVRQADLYGRELLRQRKML